MKSPRTFYRPLLLVPALAAVLTGSQASAAFVIGESNFLFTPSFRGTGSSTYFGWSIGTWDGNEDAVPPAPAIPDIVNSTPSINPGSGASITQGGTNDIVSLSNNIYAGTAGINAAALQLFIPTSGVVGSDGFTTIIIQGLGLAATSAPGGGPVTYPDTFGFGAIDGILPIYTVGVNAQNQGQWFAKWELPGNAASYTVDIFGAPVGDELAGVASVTDLLVDTVFSNAGYAPDLAVVPEPSALLLSAFAGLGLLVRRRR